MTFTQAKDIFDSMQNQSNYFDCFLPEHLSIGKQVYLYKKMAQKTNNIISGNSCML